jgi:hypothetical protein
MDGVNDTRQSRRIVVFCTLPKKPDTKGLHPMDKAHADELASKHAAIDAQINAEEHRRHPNDVLLSRLKREKLRIKDGLLDQSTH